MADQLSAPSDPAADPKKVADPSSTVSPADPAGTGAEAQANIAAAGGDAPANSIIEGVSRADSVSLQFPSLAGQTGVEVSQRSADQPKPVTKKHRKVFVIFTDLLGFMEDEFDHAPNINATRQYMLDHGLRPIGDVTFAGAEAVDAKNTALAYEVEALPAAVSVHPDAAHVVVSQD